MPRFAVAVHEVSTYEVEADGESEASELVRSAVRGETMLVPASTRLEDVEVRPIAELSMPPEPALPPAGSPSDPRDDVDVPIVRLPRIL